MVRLIIRKSSVILVDSGEKLGFMITLLLTIVIYIEYIKTSIPVFGTVGRTPYLLKFFLVIISLLTLSLIGESSPIWSYIQRFIQ